MTVRVLLADDHPLVRVGLRTVLDHATDIEVVGDAADGAEALALANTCRPDVVLMDLRMPNVDGVTATASLRDALACTVLGGRVVLVGMAAPEVGVSAYALSTEERAVIGSFCYSAAEFRDTAAWVGGAPAELARLVEGRVDLAGAADAFTRLASGTDQASKVLVFPHGVPADTAAQEA